MASRKLGEIVQRLREARGLTRQQLAEQAQVAASFITVLEGGQSGSHPSPAILQRLARALVPVSKLTETR